MTIIHFSNENITLEYFILNRNWLIKKHSIYKTDVTSGGADRFTDLFLKVVVSILIWFLSSLSFRISLNYIRLTDRGLKYADYILCNGERLVLFGFMAYQPF